jgi:hypothetical protein
MRKFILLPAMDAYRFHVVDPETVSLIENMERRPDLPQPTSQLALMVGGELLYIMSPLGGDEILKRLNDVSESL